MRLKSREKREILYLLTFCSPTQISKGEKMRRNILTSYSLLKNTFYIIACLIFSPDSEP